MKDRRDLRRKPPSAGNQPHLSQSSVSVESGSIIIGGNKTTQAIFKALVQGCSELVLCNTCNTCTDLSRPFRLSPHLHADTSRLEVEPMHVPWPSCPEPETTSTAAATTSELHENIGDVIRVESGREAMHASHASRAHPAVFVLACVVTRSSFRVGEDLN